MLDWILATLDYVSLGKAVTPHLRRLYNRFHFRRAMRKAERALLKDPTAQYVATRCSDEYMVRQIFRLRNGFFEESTGMTEAALLRRYHHCPGAFHAVMKVQPDERSANLQGYFVLLPITKECVNDISAGHIEAGRHLRESDVISNGRSPRAAYVSVVCGNGPRAQLATVNALVAEIDKLRRRGLRCLFVRPTTSEGAYALHRFVGREFPRDGRIQRVDLARSGPALTLPRREPRDRRRDQRPRPSLSEHVDRDTHKS